MPQQSDTAKLIDIFDTTRRQFQDDYLPLTHEQLQRVDKCSKLVKQDPSTMHRNIPKKRAHTILSEIWAHCPDLFIICALSTNPNTLGMLKSRSYLQEFLSWWGRVEHPKALAGIRSRHPNILPGYSDIANAPPYRAYLPHKDLVDYLSQYKGGDVSLTIRVPDDENEMPAIEISRDMCQNLIKFVMDRTTGRMLSGEVQACGQMYKTVGHP